MVEPYMRPYVESFQVSYQKWSRDHEIPELMMPLQEVWNSESRPLAKALPLVRALFVVYLAFLLRLVKGKKSRRTRSMRSESLRRRAQNLTCTNSPMSLSPSALQQSSEPTPPPPLEVQSSLQDPPLKDDEEDLDGSQAKDSALGSEGNHSDVLDSDHPIAAIDEGDEESEEEDPTRTKENKHESIQETYHAYSDAKTKGEDFVGVKLPQRVEVAARSPPPHRQLGQKGHKFRGKKIVTIT